MFLIDQLHISTFENNTGKSNVEVFEDRVNAIVQNAAGEAGKIGRSSLDKNNRFGPYLAIDAKYRTN